MSGWTLRKVVGRPQIWASVGFTHVLGWDWINLFHNSYFRMNEAAKLCRWPSVFVNLSSKLSYNIKSGILKAGPLVFSVM